MEERNTFQTGKVTTSMIKCAHGFNHYGLREAIINDDMVESMCPWCEKVETWDHVIKCQNTIEIRKEFIKEIVIELARNKPKEVHIEEIMSFVEDTLRCLENEEEEEDEEHEINQQHVGMQELFRGCVVID